MNTDSFALEAMARGAGVRVRCPASASSKRAFDVVISAMLLVIFAPLLLLAALAVAAEGEGVLFRQRRTGLNGHVFTILKFRTMTVAEDGGAVAHARPGAPRVTRIGALLRATSLDELPQLINVLRGDMSLVGPRPHALAHDHHYAALLPLYRERFSVRPGLTGLAQVAGLRGEIAGWLSDFSVVYGRNALDFRTENSINSTYGANSPTSFDSGSLIYDQLVVGADFTRPFEIGLSGPLNFAWGLEQRWENYQIEAGQPESYNRGPVAAAALQAGSQGFVGFQPSNEVDADRHNIALYADVEIPLTDKLTVEGAVRYEDYSDFGDTRTGKFSARYDFNPNFALRGSISTGFRAPALQQSFYTSTNTVIQDGQPVETGTFPATSAIAAALGARPLEAETSTNYSIGAVVRLGGFDLTVDAYKIDIDDQIVLSELIGRGFSPQVASLLDPLGVSSARFFLNGVSTSTEGVDVVGRYRLPTETLGDFDFTVAANYNDITVQETPTSSSTLNPVPPLFGRNRVLTLEDGTPEVKVSASADWSRDRLGATLRATHYGDVLQPGSTAASDYRTGAKTVVDLEGRYQLTDRVGLAVGVDNLFDEYPDYTPVSLNNNGVLGFPYYSPFGFNGRYAYARVSLRW